MRRDAGQRLGGRNRPTADHRRQATLRQPVELRDPVQRGTNFREAGWCLALTAAAYQSNLQGFKELDVVFPSTPKPRAAVA